MSQYDLNGQEKKKAGRGCVASALRTIAVAIFIVVGGIFVLALLSSGRGGSSSRLHTVVYEVDTPGITGSYSDLTYANETGDTEQHTEKLPWHMEFKAKSGQFIYLSAQSSGFGNQCKIKVDGLVIKQADSSGKYSIATCSGSVP